MYAKQVSRLYEPIEPISLPWELRSLVSDLTIQNGTRSARAIVRRRIMQTEVARMMATPLSVRAFSVTEDFGLDASAFQKLPDTVNRDEPWHAVNRFMQLQSKRTINLTPRHYRKSAKNSKSMEG